MSDGTAELTTHELLDRLTASIEGLRTDVRSERIGRRSNRVAGAIGLTVGLLVALFGAKAYVDARSITCEARTQSRVEIRTALVGVADETALYLGASDEERAEIGARAEARVLRDLPPPSCSGEAAAPATTPATPQPSTLTATEPPASS